jgi:DNA-binding MarR family transcriptional regulator
VGIQLTWYEVLAQLSSSPTGRMPMKQLAESVSLSKSGITRLIDRMERSGLVERHSCTDDGRVCFAGLTRRGLSVLQVARPVAAEGVEEYFARHVTEEEATVMATALRRVLEKAGRPLPEPVRSTA